MSEASVARERTAQGSGWASSSTVANRAALAAVNAIDVVGSRMRTFVVPASGEWLEDPFHSREEVAVKVYHS
jgi:hypothetical protein